MNKLLTQYISPPIPMRSMDWIAWFDGTEEKCVGTGETEEAALWSLLCEENSERKISDEKLKIISDKIKSLKV